MTVIDDYLAKVTPAERAELERIRQIVYSVTPDATESIGYGMPVMRYRDTYLLGFAPFKDHLSIFPGAEAIAEAKPKLAGHKTSKGTIQFTIESPLSEDLVKEIVISRLAAINNAHK